MKGIFQRLLRKAAGIRPQIIDTTAPEIRLEEWRKNSHLVGESSKVQRTPVFRAMLGVLRLEHPHNFVPFAPHQENVVARACYAAKIEGYNLCLNNLEALAKHPDKSDEPIVATFEPETLKDQTNE